MTENERLREVLKECEETGFKQIFELALHSLNDRSDVTIGFMTIKDLCRRFKLKIDEALADDPEVCVWELKSSTDYMGECYGWYKPECGFNPDIQDYGEGLIGWNYCPTCGRKIEVKE